MDERIRKVLDYIESNLSSSLKLEELAKVACMSTSQFHRAFKRDTERTPFAFIEEIKMNQAYQLIIAGNVKVHELTQQLGYEDYETLSRAFKKHFLLAPDDLKAIANRIKKDMGVNEDGIIIKTFEVESEDQIIESLEQIIAEFKQSLYDKGYSEEEIESAKAMAVRPKMSQDNSDVNLVKNKFVIAENNQIWKSILERK